MRGLKFFVIILTVTMFIASGYYLYHSMFLDAASAFLKGLLLIYTFSTYTRVHMIEKYLWKK